MESVLNVKRETAVSKRDVLAFVALFEQYKDDAFAVALRITREHAMAEDAIQDALLFLWQDRRAHNVSDMRSWFLGVVVSRALNIRKKAFRSRKREDSKRIMAKTCRAQPPDTLLQGELSDAFKMYLDALPESERELLLLRYGAGLTQSKLSELMGLPARTISDRIRAIVNHLRGDLARAGLSAALPLLSEQGLREYLLGGVRCPHGLFHKVAEAIIQGGGAAGLRVAKHSVRKIAPAAAKKSVTYLLMSASAAIALTCGFVPNKSKSAQIETRQPMPTVTTSVPTPVSIPAPKPRPFYKWSFENGPLEELKAFSGEWKFLPGATPRSNAIYAKERTLVGLPIAAPKTPMLMKVSSITPYGTGSAALCWRENDKMASFQLWALPKRSPDRSMYLYEQWIVSVDSDGRVISVWEYNKPCPSDQLGVIVINLGITEIELRAIEASEIPFSIRDIEALKRNPECLHARSGRQ